LLSHSTSILYILGSVTTARSIPRNSPASVHYIAADITTPEGCARVAEGAARQPRAVRRAFTDGFRARIDALAKLVPGRSQAARHEKALGDNGQSCRSAHPVARRRRSHALRRDSGGDGDGTRTALTEVPMSNDEVYGMTVILMAVESVALSPRVQRVFPRRLCVIRTLASRDMNAAAVQRNLGIRWRSPQRWQELASTTRRNRLSAANRVVRRTPPRDCRPPHSQVPRPRTNATNEQHSGVYS
jgi:hypothetical protein